MLTGVKDGLMTSVILRPDVGRRISRNEQDANALLWLFGQELIFVLHGTENSKPWPETRTDSLYVLFIPGDPSANIGPQDDSEN